MIRATWTALLLTAAALSAGKPINLEGRDVALVVREDGAVSASGVIRRQAAASRVFTAEFDRTQRQLGAVHGLLVAGSKHPEVYINGLRVESAPLPRPEGCIVRILETYFLPGKNEIEIRRADDEPAAPWDGTALFALDGTSEEVHFGRAFTVEPMAQPPAHPTQAKFDVLWYDCTWQPNLALPSSSGVGASLTSATVMIGMRSLDSTLNQCVLDYDPNGSSSPTLPVSRVDSGPGTPTLPYTLDNTNDRITITLPAPVPAGEEFRVRIAYSGTPSTAGTFGPPFARARHGSPATTVLYTFSEPYGARKWWPCKDLPDDKATTTIQRIIVPSGAGWQVVSNGKLQGITNNGNGTETWTWVNSFPITTYLVSMCISNYIYVSAVYTSRDGLTTMPISHAIYPENIGLEGSGAVGTLEVMNFFADTFGEYPFLPEKYFTASHYSGSGMEHQTCTSMPGGDVQDGRQRRNVHELAHMWFGDKVTCRTFDHLWLNEGFATYAEALWVEHSQGKAAFHSYVNAWSVTTTVPVIGPNSDSFSGSVVYRKGAWVLHMLRRVVGDPAFFQILRDYTEVPSIKYGTALTPDFKAVAESVSGKNLTSFFNQWLYRPGSEAPGTGGVYEPSAQPTYWYCGSAQKSGADWVTSLTITQTQAGTPFVMPIDIDFIDATSARQRRVVDNASATQDFSVNTGSFVPVEIEFDPDNWLLESRSLSINTVGLPAGQRGTAYSRSLRASHGTTPYTWTAGAGLPPGITLSSGGVLSGTPTAAGTYTFPVTVRDNANVSRTTTLRLEIQPPSGVDDWPLQTR
ncbi:MAG: M1 family aminopeptidase [Candidatus Sumerlaeaceae bacterium]|nr:M1 family aminopeptidase [Candidatus Sumerlaeaceae bacterium]